MRSTQANICRPALGLALALGLLATAQAQTAPDPTRPPEAWLALQPQVVVAPGAAPEIYEASGVTVTVTGKNRRYALVDGQVVKAGDMVNGARVLAINPNTVTVRQNDARKVLSVAPGVVKKSAPLPRRPAAGAVSN